MSPKRLPNQRSVTTKQRGHPVPKPTIDEILASRSRLNKVSTDFLKIDLETGLTFTSLALQTNDRTKKLRNREAARKAYDTIQRLIERVTLNDKESSFF